MNHQLLGFVSDLLSEPSLKYEPLSGGDISQVYLIAADSGRYVLKLQEGPLGLEMLKAEQQGLTAIGKTGTIRAPEVFHCVKFQNDALLLMEYLETRQAVEADAELLGCQVAELHRVGSSEYGWEHDNFIGRLPQKNSRSGNWADFYAFNRLLPQLQSAVDAHLLTTEDIPDAEMMVERLNDFFNEIPISCLHGDLWSGNYLIGVDGAPCVIDPAVYYGHYEVDLAMARLFGGFAPAFFHAHAEVFPVQPGLAERTDIYQLYYLLVHLNLFGASYRSAVKRMLVRYFV